MPETQLGLPAVPCKPDTTDATAAHTPIQKLELKAERQEGRYTKWVPPHPFQKLLAASWHTGKELALLNRHE